MTDGGGTQGFEDRGSEHTGSAHTHSQRSPAWPLGLLKTGVCDHQPHFTLAYIALRHKGTYPENIYKPHDPEK